MNATPSGPPEASDGSVSLAIKDPDGKGVRALAAAGLP
jgi:hypothetical protein